MKPLALALPLAAVLLGAREARADASPERGVEFGLRGGYGFAQGKADPANRLYNDIASYKFAVMLDAGYRLSPALAVGALFELATVHPSESVLDSCHEHGISCGANNLRAGVQAQVHLPLQVKVLTSTFVPWFGAGAGYERMGLQIGNLEVSYRGPFVALQAGVDALSGSGFRAGPVVELLAGQYTAAQGNASPQPIDERTVHAWLTVGLRAAFTSGTDPGSP